MGNSRLIRLASVAITITTVMLGVPFQTARFSAGSDGCYPTICTAPPGTNCRVMYPNPCTALVGFGCISPLSMCGGSSGESGIISSVKTQWYTCTGGSGQGASTCAMIQMKCASLERHSGGSCTGTYVGPGQVDQCFAAVNNPCCTEGACEATEVPDP
jgi:hypothetical protein